MKISNENHVKETFDCSLDYSFPGTSLVYLNLSTNDVGVDSLKMNSTNDTLIRVQVIKSETLYILNEVICLSSVFLDNL